VPSVTEGITVEGEGMASGSLDSDSAFDQMLRDKVAAGREAVDEDSDAADTDGLVYRSREGSGFRSQSEREAAGTANEIKFSLLESGGVGANVQEGLTFGDPKREASETRLSPESERLVTEAGARIDTERAELAEGRVRDLESEAFGTLERSDDPVERASAWAILDDRAKLDAIYEDGYVTEDEAAELERNASAILSIGQGELASKQLAAELQGPEAEAAQALNRWVLDNGLTREQAHERFADALAVAEIRGVGDVIRPGFVPGRFVPGRSPEAYDRVLRMADAEAQELRRLDRQDAFKASLFEEDRDVSAGLTFNSGNGHVPMAPRPTFNSRLSPERIEAAANRRPMTGAEFKSDLMKPDFVADIRRAYEQGTDARARFEKEQAEALAQARANL
jgi:hypothetical protein